MRGKRGRRMGAAALVVLLMMTLLAGCVGRAKEAESLFTGDKDAIRLLARSNATYLDALEAHFPDIKFDIYYYGGLNPSMTMNQLLEEDELGDICITSLQATDEMAKEHLLDLSGYAFCNRYEPSMLSQFDVDGRIYQLPGYVTMRNIVYNKTMFKEHGWKEPENFDELVALCRQIREETEDITPIVMGAAAVGYYFTTMTSYAQAEFLYTPEGREWTRKWQEGTASAKEGFGTGIEMTQELIDAGAFDHEKNLGMWDSALFRERMLTGEAAMLFAWGGQSQIAAQMKESTEFEFAAMPFYNRAGQAFIGTNIPYYIGITKELGEKGNEKKLKKALEVLDWLSTEEGIAALTSDSLAAIYPLKDATNSEVYEMYQEFWNSHLDSIKAPMLYAGYEHILVPAAETIIDAVQGNGTLDGLAEQIDEIHKEYLVGGKEAVEAGSFTCEFTHPQTVQVHANVLWSRGDSDIALVSDGTTKNGVINIGGSFGKFFEGPIIEDQLTNTIPGMVATAPVVQMSLTGSQIKDLLEKGKYNENAAGEGAYFPYYWAGMDVKWAKGRVASMTLKDGTPLSDDVEYKVSFAGGDYDEALEEQGSPVELSYMMTDVLYEYLQEYSPMSPETVQCGKTMD